MCGFGDGEGMKLLLPPFTIEYFALQFGEEIGGLKS